MQPQIRYLWEYFFHFLAYCTRTMAVLFLKDGIFKWLFIVFLCAYSYCLKKFIFMAEKKQKHSLQTYLPPECKRHIEDFFSTICRNILGSIYTYFFLLHILLFIFWFAYFFILVSLICSLDILFPSNDIIHKSLCGLCFLASDPLIDKFYKNLSIKGSEAQKQRPEELLWMLWLEEKSIFKQRAIDWTFFSFELPFQLGWVVNLFMIIVDSRLGPF